MPPNLFRSRNPSETGSSLASRISVHRARRESSRRDFSHSHPALGHAQRCWTKSAAWPIIMALPVPCSFALSASFTSRFYRRSSPGGTCRLEPASSQLINCSRSMIDLSIGSGALPTIEWCPPDVKTAHRASGRLPAPRTKLPQRLKHVFDPQRDSLAGPLPGRHLMAPPESPGIGEDFRALRTARAHAAARAVFAARTRPHTRTTRTAFTAAYV